MKKIETRHYGLLAVAFVVGLAAAVGLNKAHGQQIIVAPAIQSVASADQSVMVTQTRVLRPRIIVPRTLVQSTMVAQPSRAAMTFESRPAPAYTVVEEPREPFVIRGLFTDRVRVPRGKTLSVVSE